MKWAESGRPQCVNGRWLMPGRDINHVSTPDNFVPAGFRGRHAKTGSLLERLRRVIPAGIEPKFSSAEELMAWHREEGARRAAEVDKINQQARAEKIFGRSGIQNLHRGCTFANYEVITAGQKHALTMAKSYAQNFGSGFASFVFSGSPGTGKNHLAAAIGNSLLKDGRTVLVVTVPDLSTRVRPVMTRVNPSRLYWTT